MTAAVTVPNRTDSVFLRPAGNEDREFLLRVYSSTREAELQPTGWTREAKDAFLSSQFQAQDSFYRQAFPKTTFDVIVSDGVDAGRLYVDRSGNEIAILDIALLPEHQRAGIGTSILRSLLHEATAAGKAVAIHVERLNPALSLYQRLGFQMTEDQGVYLFLKWLPEAEPAQ